MHLWVPPHNSVHGTGRESCPGARSFLIPASPLLWALRVPGTSQAHCDKACWVRAPSPALPRPLISRDPGDTLDINSHYSNACVVSVSYLSYVSYVPPASDPPLGCTRSTCQRKKTESPAAAPSGQWTAGHNCPHSSPASWLRQPDGHPGWAGRYALVPLPAPLFLGSEGPKASCSGRAMQPSHAQSRPCPQVRDPGLREANLTSWSWHREPCQSDARVPAERGF